MNRKTVIAVVVLTAVGLVGCASKKAQTNVGRYHLQKDMAPHAKHIPNLAKIKDAEPKNEPKSRYGNPKSYVVFNKTYHVMDGSKNYKQKGLASWYGKKFHGYKTSSGEVYNMFEMTAAHKSLPLPTYAWVKNLDNGKKVIVKINDRGPFHDDRIIDLSYAAASKLDILNKGTARVEVEAIDPVAFAKNKSKFDKNLSKPLFASREDETVQQKEASKSVVYDAMNASEMASMHYLQVGAFRDRVNAQSLTAKLQSLLHAPIHIKETQLADQSMYVVRVGPFNEMEHLTSAHEILAKAAYSPIRVKEEI